MEHEMQEVRSLRKQELETQAQAQGGLSDAEQDEYRYLVMCESGPAESDYNEMPLSPTMPD